MPDTQQWVLFMLAGVLLNLAPGPDVLYVVGRALRSGARTGIVAALGINAGCLVHVGAAAVGVGALLAASATAFTALKWLGAAYLVAMGARLLVARQVAPGPGLPRGEAAASLREAFAGGLLTNVLNPKVAIFFLAFVPQFIPAQSEAKVLAFLALGAVFVANSVVVSALWALAAAWIARSDAVRRSLGWLDRAAGVLFIGFGLKLALSDPPTR